MNKHYLLYPTLVVGSLILGFVVNPASSELDKVSQENLALQANLEETQEKLAQTQEELGSKERSRKELNDKLWESNQQLKNCQNSKDEIQKELDQTQNELNSCRVQVSQLQPVIAPSTNYRTSQSRYISGTCADLRRRGLSNFRPGDPNYTSARDRDNDGIACES